MTRSEVLLSLQRALVGMVFVGLTRVDVDWEKTSINILCFVDGNLSEDDQDALDEIETVVTADFSPSVEVSLKLVPAASAGSIPPQQVTVFQVRSGG